MNMRARPLTSLLLVTVASSCLLSACSRADFASKISGSEGRKEQMVDLNRRHTIRNAEQLTKCGWSAWDGVELVGLPVRTWVRGQEVFREEKEDVDRGSTGFQSA